MAIETVTRFAPSPTGELHLGHAYSALFAESQARRAGGRFLLRMEDIDPVRCRPDFARRIEEDLAWLSLRWDGPVRHQSQHLDDYAAALDRLVGLGVLYPCFCTRKEIQEEVARAGHAPHGPEGLLYPGICRGMSDPEAEARKQAGEAFALRLYIAKAKALAGDLVWHDRQKGTIAARPEIFGDVVLARKDIPTSYHMAVTLDDHIQGVTLVTRGEDLFDATHIHRLLQALLGLDVPDYLHHPLLTDASGRRFAKRDKSLTLRALREAGTRTEDLRAMTGLGET